MRIGLTVTITTLVVAMLFGAESVRAEKRVALVVGNSAYTHADPLINPLNDARDMRAALMRLGFEVIFGEDLDQTALRRAIGQFAGIVAGADVAVVYFAGHGATFGDTPYVVPVDAEFSSLQNMPYELVPVETLIGELRHAKGVRIAILDACRDNAAERELKRQAAPRGGEVSRGLGPMKNPEGLILAYATQYLSTARDLGTNRNSPFTAALLNNIATSGLDVKDLFFKVGREVVTATQGTQRPEISISIYDQYVLVPAPPVPALAQQLTAVVPPARPAVPSADPCSGAVTVSFRSRCAAPLTVLQERGLQPKDSFRECEQCPEVVVVPSGSFTMGSPAGEKGRESTEGPQHRVTFSHPFAVGKFSVTFDEWDACVADGGCRGYKPSDQGWGRGRRPVINVSWGEAKAYVAWLSGKTGKTYRLLSEAEREYVTRAETTTPFWWGSSISPQQANYNGNYTYGNGPKGEYRQRTLPVDSFRQNPWGLYQVHGNVREWTEDCYHDSDNGNYNGAPTDGSAWLTGACTLRLLRGGSWVDYPRTLRSAYLSWATPDSRGDSFGFRVGRTLISP